MSKRGPLRQTMSRIWDVLRGDVFQVRSTMAETDPDAEVLRMRGTTATIAAAQALGAGSILGIRYELVLRTDRLELWPSGDGPALTVPYDRVESASPTTSRTFVPQHGVAVLVGTDGPGVELPLFPFDGTPTGEDGRDQLADALRVRGVPLVR